MSTTRSSIRYAGQILVSEAKAGRDGYACVSLHLPAHMIRRVDELAAVAGISRGAWFRSMIAAASYTGTVRSDVDPAQLALWELEPAMPAAVEGEKKRASQAKLKSPEARRATGRGVAAAAARRKVRP